MIKILIFLNLFSFLTFCVAKNAYFQASKEQPNNVCPHLFSFETFGQNETVGKFTLYEVTPGTHKIRISFVLTNSTFGKAQVSLYDKPEIVQAQLERGAPISFRIRFSDPNDSPRLVLISQDNHMLCMDKKTPKSTNVIDVEKTLEFPELKSQSFDESAVRVRRQTIGDYVSRLEKFNWADIPKFLNEAPIKEVIQNVAGKISKGQPLEGFNDDNGKIRETLGKYGLNPSNVAKKVTVQPTERTEAVRNPVQMPLARQQQQPGSKNLFLEAAMDKARINCGREGIRRREISEFIYGGNVIEPGQFPWLAAIQHQTSPGHWVYKCGGSLISARLVLTAAHCLIDVSNNLVSLRVYLGRHNIITSHEENEVYKPTLISVPHPEHKRGFPDADIGLVVLSEAVEFTTRVSPICLWSAPIDLSTIVGGMGVVVGWGVDESGVTSVLPKMISVPIASELECRRNHPIFHKFLTDRTLCAGRRDGSGPLHGDSGDALMMKRGGRWMLRGVVSVGMPSSGDDPHVFVVYTDVAKFLSWISNEMNKWA